jgi:hypothetical protein
MRDRRKAPRQQREKVDIATLVMAWSRPVLQLSVLAFMISLGYILYGLFSGKLRGVNDPSEVQRLVGNFTLMGQLLTLSSFLAALSLLIITFGEIAFAIVIGLVGAGLMFGMPILIGSNLPQGSDFATPISNWCTNAGLVVLFLVGMRIVHAIVQQIGNATHKTEMQKEIEEASVAQKKKKAKRIGLWDPCWELPYCHDAVKEVCPAYKARKSCWRFGYGCNCDPGLIEQLIRTGGATKGKGTAKSTSEQRTHAEAYVRSDLDADAPKARERTIPCQKCAIFVEHQRQKFRIVNPVAIVGTLVGLAFLYKPLTMLYSQIIQWAARLAARFTLDSELIDPSRWIGYLDSPFVKGFFFVFVALIVLSYVLRAVEWLVLKKMVL